MNEETQQRVAKLAKRIGSQNTSTLLSALGRKKKFVDALESDIGVELVRHMMSGIEDSVARIVNDKDSEEDRARIKVYMELIGKWESVVKSYEADLKTFEEKSK